MRERKAASGWTYKSVDVSRNVFSTTPSTLAKTQTASNMDHPFVTKGMSLISHANAHDTGSGSVVVVVVVAAAAAVVAAAVVLAGVVEEAVRSSGVSARGAD